MSSAPRHGMNPAPLLRRHRSSAWRWPLRLCQWPVWWGPATCPVPVASAWMLGPHTTPLFHPARPLTLPMSGPAPGAASTARSSQTLHQAPQMELAPGAQSWRWQAGSCQKACTILAFRSAGQEKATPRRQHGSLKCPTQRCHLSQSLLPGTLTRLYPRSRETGWALRRQRCKAVKTKAAPYQASGLGNSSWWRKAAPRLC
mmetsp:Transcript_75244/g.179658  ORF Transcript_75244/g.179658 Transcript_75244/m.179658 type:complete len:201 (-) Transcript_75244:3138-3740(-)